MLKIREHLKKDIPLRVKWLNNEKVNKFLGSNYQEEANINNQNEWFKRYQKDISKKFFTFEYEGKPVGFMGLSNINFINKNADFFIMIGENEYLGRGLGKEAFVWLINFGFIELELNKLCLGVFEENIVAVNLYKKLGFEIEGILKSDAFFDGKFHNTLLMTKFDTRI